MLHLPERLIYCEVDDDDRPAVHPGVQSGLYIVQSSHEPTCYRAGAGGVVTASSTLSNRLRQHRSSPPNRNDINWTEYHRPWKPIWVVQFPGCRQLTARLCEALLISELAARFHFISEATGSGFHASADQAPSIVTFARSLEPQFEKILTRQAEPVIVRSWVKGAKDAQPSGYVDWLVD